jgi:LysM repeat protein
MSEMGHWWRLFVAFLSAFAAGCSISQDAAPTSHPTSPPSITLTVRVLLSPTPPSPPSPPQASTAVAQANRLHYTVVPGDTLLAIARRFGVALGDLQNANGGLNPDGLQIGQELVIPDPAFNSDGQPILPTRTPPALPLPPPNCQPTPTDHILCLGEVENPLDYPLQGVSVRLRLLGRDGTVLANAVAGLEQNVVMPGQTAPYRLLLDADWNAYAGADAALDSAEPAPSAEPVHIDIRDEQGQSAGGQYFLLATLRNPLDVPVSVVRATAMLYDSSGHLVGYRIVPLNQQRLDAGATLPLGVTLIPQLPGDGLHHTLTVEAVRLSP